MSFPWGRRPRVSGMLLLCGRCLRACIFQNVALTPELQTVTCFNLPLAHEDRGCTEGDQGAWDTGCPQRLGGGKGRGTEKNTRGAEGWNLAGKEGGRDGRTARRPPPVSSVGASRLLLTVTQAASMPHLCCVFQVFNGYFVHFFAPENMDPIPKNILFVIDVSGSMWGVKMKQVSTPRGQRSVGPLPPRPPTLRSVHLSSLPSTCRRHCRLL